MATTNKAKSTPDSSSNEGGNQGPGGFRGYSTTADTQLATIVRGGSQRIIASLLASAARCGEQHDWQEMAEYQGLVNTLLDRGGLQQIIAAPVSMAMGVSAGART